MEKFSKIKPKCARDDYTQFQEDLDFKKELNILRNDFYFKMLDSKHAVLVDYIYNPLDILGADAYSVRKIEAHKTFFLLAEGMGKGVSASPTSMVATSFVDYQIDKMIQQKRFSIAALIDEFLFFLRPILLEEETFSVDFLLYDSQSAQFEYAKFSMPAFLLADDNGHISKIRSNNPPISKWTQSYKIDTYNVENIRKFLFYTDRLVENDTKENRPYGDFLEEDFKSSFTREELKEKFLDRIAVQEEDETLIFINKLELNEKTLLCERVFDTSMDAIEEANEWYVQLTRDTQAAIAFSELFTNAYEHGNLGIDNRTKHKLLEADVYFEELARLEETCDKKITVRLYRLENEGVAYMVTQIIDEGEGFDTDILATIFRKSKKFNGRGVFVSRKNSMGIYYNEKGNSVLFLTKTKV